VGTWQSLKDKIFKRPIAFRPYFAIGVAFQAKLNVDYIYIFYIYYLIK